MEAAAMASFDDNNNDARGLMKLSVELRQMVYGSLIGSPVTRNALRATCRQLTREVDDTPIPSPLRFQMQVSPGFLVYSAHIRHSGQWHDVTQADHTSSFFREHASTLRDHAHISISINLRSDTASDNFQADVLLHTFLATLAAGANNTQSIEIALHNSSWQFDESCQQHALLKDLLQAVTMFPPYIKYKLRGVSQIVQNHIEKMRRPQKSALVEWIQLKPEVGSVIARLQTKSKRSISAYSLKRAFDRLEQKTFANHTSSAMLGGGLSVGIEVADIRRYMEAAIKRELSDV